jgi:hypothetical protein
MMLKEKDAVPHLMNCGLKRNAARELLDDPEGTWELRKIDGVKGHPVGVFLCSCPGEKGNGGGNTTPQKRAFSAGLFDADFRRPHPEHTAEIHHYQPIEKKSVETPPISAVNTNFTGTQEVSAERDSNAKDPSNGHGDPDDDEVRL